MVLFLVFVYFVKEADDFPGKQDSEEEKECYYFYRTFLDWFNYLIFCKTVASFIERKIALKKAKSSLPNDFLENDTGYSFCRFSEVFICNVMISVTVVSGFYM